MVAPASSGTGDIDNVELRADVLVCGPCGSPPVDHANPFTCAKLKPAVVKAGGGQGKGAKPVQTATIGTALSCIGGGTVPTQDDIVPAESWS